MKVKDVMNKKFQVLKSTDSIAKALDLLIKTSQSAMPVVDKKGAVVGELDQKKLLLIDVGQLDFVEQEGLGFEQLRLILSKRAKKVEEIMEKHNFSVSPNDEILQVAKLIYEEDISTIPVIDNNKLVGVITDIDILKHYKKIIGKKK